MKGSNIMTKTQKYINAIIKRDILGETMWGEFPTTRELKRLHSRIVNAAINIKKKGGNILHYRVAGNEEFMWDIPYDTTALDKWAWQYIRMMLMETHDEESPLNENHIDTWFDRLIPVECFYGYDNHSSRTVVWCEK